ncbi:WG repeat-containing protein [Sphingobacterium sp. SRCM116780]|uniref:WG repeat-containing protein n=1 Tax=Sphingobacterium sp. SRCM116780 TaxID=2907623 RepID=UPI001F37C3D6|nr:WG repeat-containing protein [Sphingobacterium sp. SRCM116780]UIR56786.1 WG repeat-containing protein [Sphingobacterium sp. SRCM116780]
MIIILLIVSVSSRAQSLFFDSEKEEFLEQLRNKSIPEIRIVFADQVESIHNFQQQLKRISSFNSNKTEVVYTEETAESTTPYTLPDAKLIEEQFHATIKTSVFNQLFSLPNSDFQISPPDQEDDDHVAYLDLNYVVNQAYKDGKSYGSEEVGLRAIDSLKAIASQHIPTKMATVKMNVSLQEMSYRNGKIYLDWVNKNKVKFRVDTTINKDLLEVYALTSNGKLVDHKNFTRSSYKPDGSIEILLKEIDLLFADFVKKIDTNEFGSKEDLINEVKNRINTLKLPERSPVDYKEYGFKGNVAHLVFYFKEDSKLFKQDITAYNKETKKNQYEVFSDENERKGISDVDGNIRIKEQYKSLQKENDHYYYATDTAYHHTNYYFDEKKNVLINLKMDGYLDGQENGMVVIRKIVNRDTVNHENEYLHGLYNKEGKLILPLTYRSLQVIGQVIIAQKEDTYSLLNLNGQPLNDEKFDEVNRASDLENEMEYPLLIANKNDKYGILDLEGNQLCPFKYDAINSFYNGKAVVVQVNKDGDDRFGLIDNNLKEIVPLEYDLIFNYKDGMAIFMKDGRYGLLDEKGQIMEPAIYDSMEEVSDGMVVVRNDEGKYGAINNKGELTVPFIFSEINDFQAGYAFVMTEDQYGIIDKMGKYMLQGKKPGSYGLSLNWKGKKRTYLFNDKLYNYKGDLIKKQ